MLAGVGARENDGEDYDRAVLAMVVVASTGMGFRMIIWLKPRVRSWKDDNGSRAGRNHANAPR
jgi:hypothetical protein